jgi:hypothetical protein
MPLTGTSGCVADLGGRPPRSTRPNSVALPKKSRELKLAIRFFLRSQ